MNNFSTWMIAIFMVMFWLFRAVVGLCTQYSIDMLGIVSYNFTYEVIIAFLTIPCIVLVVKRKLTGGLLYLALYGIYFGGDVTAKLNTLSKEVNENITNYDLGVATQKIYDFIWNEFCDWYIEIVKTRLYGDDKESKLMAQVTLNEVLMNSLKLLHPIMPFITEEIYLQLFNIDESIMISKFPQFDEKYNFKADEEEIEKLKEIIIGIRNLRASSNVHPSKKTELIFVTTKYKYLINQSEGFLKKLGYSENIKVQENKEGIAQNALSIITDGIELYIPFEELVDIEEERKRMEEEKKKVIAEIERASKMLSNPGFVNKAPEAKINEEKAKLEKYQNMLKNLEERLK